MALSGIGGWRSQGLVDGARFRNKRSGAWFQFELAKIEQARAFDFTTRFLAPISFHSRSKEKIRKLDSTTSEHLRLPGVVST